LSIVFLAGSGFGSDDFAHLLDSKHICIPTGLTVVADGNRLRLWVGHYVTSTATVSYQWPRGDAGTANAAPMSES
jgi:hypothetical protein